jgi:uncharacterized protein YajQ (UPF0234 family)
MAPTHSNNTKEELEWMQTKVITARIDVRDLATIIKAYEGLRLSITTQSGLVHQIAHDMANSLVKNGIVDRVGDTKEAQRVVKNYIGGQALDLGTVEVGTRFDWDGHEDEAVLDDIEGTEILEEADGKLSQVEQTEGAGQGNAAG